jgi:hypothetical protein
VAPGMEPDDDLWGCLVHPPQLQYTSHMARGYTNLTHMDIQGEPGGDSGVQQQTATGVCTGDMGRVTVRGDSACSMTRRS